MKEKIRELEKEYHIQKQAMYKSDEQEAYLEGLKQAIYILKRK